MTALQIQKILNGQMAKKNFKAAKLTLEALNVQRTAEGIEPLQLHNLQNK